MLNLFDPQPPPSALPERVPSPFATPPHPLATRATEELRRTVAALAIDLDAPGAGKMFGVLVVATPSGHIGYLRAFSGMLAGSWHVPGFAPPVFDEPARSAFWPAGEAELAALDDQLRALAAVVEPLRAGLAALDERNHSEAAALHACHTANRRARHVERDRIARKIGELEPTIKPSDESARLDREIGEIHVPSPSSPADQVVGEVKAPDEPARIGEIKPPDATSPADHAIGEIKPPTIATSSPGINEITSPDAGSRTDRDIGELESPATAELHALDQQSRGDAAERKRLLARHADEREALAARLMTIDLEIAKLERAKAARSRELLVAIYQTYAFASARGEQRTLHELFAPAEPPGGAGDCAAPKLLALAYRERLRPIALAEIWCGAPPATGGRHDGTFYPACRGKCGPIVTHQLGGLACDEMPIFGLPSVAEDEPHTVFEDEWIAVVDKPVGLLSVPGRSGLLRDSVLTRLRARYPDATGPLLVHRLDLDTSGLLLAAKDQKTYGALQQLFERRLIEKRYFAWLDGNVEGERGTIDLALRVDVDDRPRQIHDPEHGKPAVTDWQVLERTGARTRVAMWPRTGRTHQLRVHAAHPLGLGAPIIGDRLYARNAHDEPRLLLHAESLSFVHSRTHERLELRCPAPF